MFFQNINDTHCQDQHHPFIRTLLLSNVTQNNSTRQPKIYTNYLFLQLFCNFKQVCLVAPGFVHGSSMLLQLSSHSQHSCTSQEATAGCSPHPHLAAPLTDTQSCKERTTPHIPLPSCQQLPKKMDQRRVPKEPSASKRSVQRQEAQILTHMNIRNYQNDNKPPIQHRL